MTLMAWKCRQTCLCELAMLRIDTATAFPYTANYRHAMFSAYGIPACIATATYSKTPAWYSAWTTVKTSVAEQLWAILDDYTISECFIAQT